MHCRWQDHLVAPALFFAAAVLAVGCSGPNAQVARCQSEKQELLTVIEQEKARSQAFQERALALESRLDQSEKQLAQLVRPGSRFAQEDETRTASKAARPSDKAGGSSGGPIHEPQDAGGSSKTAPSTNQRSSLREMKLQAPNAQADRADSRLAALAERDTRLEIDGTTGLARLKIDIPFETGQAELNAEGRRRLDEVAAWLKSTQTSDLRVLVAGHSSGMKKPPAGAEGPRFDNDRQLGAARALAVADYLDRRGIKEDRLAVIGSGARGNAGLPGSVDILLAEPQTPVAGLPPATIRR